MWESLRPSRRADREKAAAALREIAHKYGMSWEAQHTSADVVVRLSHPCGARASIWIDRTSKDQELVAWYTELDSGWTYPDAFGDVFGEVNQYHHQKATKVYPWATLPAHIAHDCRKIAGYATERA